MSTPSRSRQHGGVLLGLAGGMLVVAGGFGGAYYVVETRSVAAAATPQGHSDARPSGDASELQAMLAKTVELTAAGFSTKLTWGELGVEIDREEVGRGGGALALRVDRDKAVKALWALKGKLDRAPVNAYLDLEARKVLDDRPGSGLDVWGSLPRIAAAARNGVPSIALATIEIPATVTKSALGIDDISQVLGYYVTKFPVNDRDRNFNLKLAASHLNGVVLKPGVEFSFNDTVGERSQKNGYKVAHVITAGEMVDGLAGGTCQISTTLFGAAFFAGLDIVKTTNHSRPSAYTPLGFDSTVVWPNTDLKLANPYDFPVVIHYIVAAGEARVEVLGKPRPWDKVEFARSILEETEFTKEDRYDDELAEGETTLDQEGFPGYKLARERRFYKGGKVVKTNRWIVTYKPVTEYTRHGTSTDPDAKKAVAKPSHNPPKPGGSGYSMAQ